MKELREEGIKEYAELRKNHPKLPLLKELETEFECRFNAPIISAITHVLLERMGQSAGHIEIIFQPARMADAIESKFHDEKEKEKLFEFYKKTLSIVHEISAASFNNREARIKTLINAIEFYKKELKPTMKQYLEEQAKGWLKQEKPEQKNQYFG